MPAAVHAPLINPTGFMFKERSTEPTAFTAVNGTNSPFSPRRLNAIHNMSTETIHMRPYSRQSPERTQEPKISLPNRDEWNAVRKASEHDHQPVSPTVSPTSSDLNHSPTSPPKRKRSSSAEEYRSSSSLDEPSSNRPRLDSYAPSRREVSPNTAAQVQQLAMEPSHPRTLPPMDRPDPERAWPQSHNGPHNGYHESHRRDSRTMDLSSEGMLHSEAHMPAMDDPHRLERSSTIEMTRAGVQVDPKKRKRQFANRTKTGCGTCRRRKKKCDEAKPECNNCLRGAFICEGYANKIPWPKNGVQKPHPPLQAKDSLPTDQSPLYHTHGATREGYTGQTSPTETSGDRIRPIVIEEHDHQPTRNEPVRNELMRSPPTRNEPTRNEPTRNEPPRNEPSRTGWSNGWSEPPRAAYSQEQHPPPDYSQPPPTPHHGGPLSSDQKTSPTTQMMLPSRQHNPRIYHHTPQTMSQVVNQSPVVTAEAALHHQSQSQHQAQPLPLPHYSHAPPMAPLTAAPPGPPPAHYAPPPPRSQKSEKEKMLCGEPFLPFSPQLIEERERCKAAAYRFNNSDNPQKDIGRDSRDNLFRAILAARWALAYTEPGKQPCGHFGREGVFIETPFMCEYGYNISIGDNVDIGTSCKFLDSGRITIGRNSTIGANVTIDTQRTPPDVKYIKGSRRTAVAAEVHIGENVHIGSNCTILAGVRIGAGAIIHPGSVVVRDIPGNCIARGPIADYV